MREKSEINDLFRTRLQDMKMEVRSEFWEMLEQDLKNKPSPMTAFRTRCLRWVAAASVLLLWMYNDKFGVPVFIFVYLQS